MTSIYDRTAIHSFFLKHIAPQVDVIETARMTAVNRFWRYAAIAAVLDISIIVFLLQSSFLYDMHNENNGFVVGCFAAIIGFSFYGVQLPISRFKSKVKKTLLGDIVKIFPSFFYYEDKKFPHNLISESKIFPDFDYMGGGDLIRGYYQDVAVTSANAKLIDQRKSGRGRRYEVTVFEGPVYHLSFPRAFKGVLRLRTDAGWLGNKVFGLGEGLERVRLEDPQFEKTFEVYASDQIEARYIMTTGFMELLLRVAARHNNKLEAAFFNNHMLIKVEGQTSRLQLSNPLRHINWLAEFTRFVDEFQDAFALVDELKLNQKIGL